MQKYYFCGMQKNSAIRIESNVDLKPINTFGVQGKTKYLIQFISESQLPQILRYASNFKDKVLFTGGGSNILFTGNWDGLIVKIATKGIEVLDEDDDYVYVKAEAGEVWDDLVNYCINNGYGGIENLSLIPGSVGSSPIQNIGAYGVELKDVFYMLEAVSLRTGEVREFYREECQFGYRYSVFKGVYKGVYLILSVIFKLSKKPVLNLSYGAVEQEMMRLQLPRNIASVSQAIINIRKSKLPDPMEIGNAGSFFKNPLVSKEEFMAIKEKHIDIPYFINDDEYKLAAGWMIEKCGWKGYREGDAGVHEKQALVLVNYGKANGRQIKELAEKISDSVFDRFNIRLEPEVNILTCVE